jgi:hypothetical protein
MDVGGRPQAAWKAGLRKDPGGSRGARKIQTRTAAMAFSTSAGGMVPSTRRTRPLAS